MANVIIVLILVAAVGYGIYSFIHHLRHGGGCCGEHDAPAKKVRAADTNKSHYPHRLVMGVDGMTCQNCQRHVENALNVMPGTWATVDLAAQNVTILTKDEADEDAIRQAIRDAVAETKDFQMLQGVATCDENNLLIHSATVAVIKDNVPVMYTTVSAE